MAKILFVMKYPLVDAYSVKDKFNGQMRAAEQLGYEVWFVGFDASGMYLIHRGEKKLIKKLTMGNFSHYIHTLAFVDLFDSVCRVLKKMRFDVVYMRHCPLLPVGLRMCRKIKASGAKFVVEIPTFPPEKEQQPTALRRAVNAVSERRWVAAAQCVSLFTLIGEPAQEYRGVPAINIDNGINVENIPLRKPVSDDKVHLLAIAAMSDWQGYDRVIRGIAALDEEMKEKIVLDLVGVEGDGSLAKWLSLAQELSLDKQVVFHGYKKGAELEPYFDCAALGIGSLGLYRKNFTSASALKLREYCARGLPFVYAGDDPAFRGELPFCMQIPNDDSIVDVAELVAFAQKHHDLLKIRDFAEQKITWEVQMKKVFGALK